MDATVERIREFNRTWTEVIGLLDHGLLQTEHSLAEARVLFELGRHGPTWERLELRDRLDMDASYLTRVLGRLEGASLVTTEPSDVDGRRVRLSLTRAGQDAFAELDRRSRQQICQLLEPLSEGQRRDLVAATTIARGLLQRRSGDPHVELRGPDAGDLGWVVQRHGEIYHDEFGWDASFEGLVAQIVARYHAEHRPGRERAWIAWVDGARAGCVFCCERDADAAQLRLLLVEPWARGLALGTRLVDDCIAFARDAGYLRLVLWTNDVLVAARRIYHAAHFELVSEAAHHSFGHDLVGQDWTLALR